jgi:hypothetical protein
MSFKAAAALSPAAMMAIMGPVMDAAILAAEQIGQPVARTLALATAFQATDPTKPALVTVNLTSIANLTLAAGTTNTADLVIGATSGVAGGTGTVIAKYRNSLTGLLVVGLNINTDSGVAVLLPLPVGWFFAIRQTSGSVVITSAFDQALGLA